ncbi:MAG: SRPBCC family protein [Gemmatimonadota bacterium]|jgi:hypothetical protein|nr:SRPBCC family protein [Gemmatimonadota bacterium]
MLRKVLIGVGILLVLVIGGGFLLPDVVTVTRSTTIQAPPEAIYPMIATPRQWPVWSPWNDRDPNMAIAYSGPESGAGAKWEWKSASQGDGSMVMTRGTAPNDLGFELTIVGMGPPSRGAFALRPTGAGTQVEWTMTSEMAFGPIGGWFGLFFRPMLEKDFAQGLAKLKQKAEAAPSAPSAHVPAAPPGTP